MTLLPIAVEEIGFAVPENNVLEFVGKVAGECYMSDMTVDKCINRALNVIKRGHHSPWEHYHVTLKCTVDRGVSHALVRHRHCAFQQSSTIYHKYSNIVLTDKSFGSEGFYRACEIEYNKLIAEGKEPSEARDVLPNALATNLIITTNIRQWMYMIHRRTGYGDSKKMHLWAEKTREWFEKQYPRITLAFDTWYDKHPL